ncbi:MAG: XRE family transcriptional regulator [Alphaproteobacteria bacterium]|nr:MAG: XRE family transcriptional regulator [Alphaproteobacteria bacterium]
MASVGATPAKQAVGRTLRLTRHKLGLSQTEFACHYGISVAPLRDWEQGRRTPSAMALAYIKVITAHPKLVQKAVA